MQFPENYYEENIRHSNHTLIGATAVSVAMIGAAIIALYLVF